MISEIQPNPLVWSDPESFTPYQVINLCGNSLQSVGHIFEISEAVHPLLIGVGERRPRIWLASPTDNSRRRWKYVVEDNRAIHPAFVIKEKRDTVRILAGGTTLLNVQAFSPMYAIVSTIDLRPIGLDIVGDKSFLRVGNNHLQDVNIVATSVAFGLR